MNDSPPPEPAPESAPGPGLWETWGHFRLLVLALALVSGNFACQLLWYERDGGLFGPVLAGAVVGVFLPLVLLGRRWGWRPSRDFGLDRPAPFAAAGAVLMALAALAPGSLLAWLSQRLQPVDPEWLAHYVQSLPDTPVEIAVAFVAVVLAGPLAEEIIFRGLFHRVFSRTWGAWPAIVASSLVFGLVHGEPWYLLGLIGIGLVLAFVWEATGSLTCCWLAHAAYNGVTLGVMLAEGPAGAREATPPTAMDLAVAAGSLAMLLLVGRWLRRADAR